MTVPYQSATSIPRHIFRTFAGLLWPGLFEILRSTAGRREQKLPQRPEPYWTVISEGCALGYRRGCKGGKWIARFRDDMGRQHYEALGAAVDARDPDNLTAFSFAQAQSKARDVFTRKAKEIAGDFVPTDGAFTVADALTSYLARYLRRGGKASGRIESAARTYILPALGQLPVANTYQAAVRGIGITESPKSRSGPHPQRRCTQAFRPNVVTPELNRRRGATANRILTVLKAALNEAYHEGRIPINEAWQRVKRFGRSIAPAFDTSPTTRPVAWSMPALPISAYLSSPVS